MKTFLRSLIVAVVLCGAVNSVFAEIHCWPGFKVYSPGAGDSWICWNGMIADCLYCEDEIIVRG